MMPNAYSNQALRSRPKPFIGMAIGQPVNTTLGYGRIVNIQRTTFAGNINVFYSSPADPFLITVLLDDTQKVINIPVSLNAFTSYNAGVKIGGASIL